MPCRPRELDSGLSRSQPCLNSAERLDSLDFYSCAFIVAYIPFYIMPLDPTSALSLAAAIVQFVDFSSKLVSKGYHIYQSANGALPENLELEGISRDLSLINVKLRANQSSGPMTKDQESLESLSNDCTKMADELLGRLEKLKVTDDTKHRKLKSFRQALKTVWNKQALDEMSSRLKDLRAQLEFHVLLSLK